MKTNSTAMLSLFPVRVRSPSRLPNQETNNNSLDHAVNSASELKLEERDVSAPKNAVILVNARSVRLKSSKTDRVSS